MVAPPIQIISKSLTLTERISPNRTPIISNLINDKKPNTTNPIARDEWDKSPNNESLAKLVVFCSFNKSNATKDETTNTDNEILISNVTDNITPNKAECASVSPKNDSLLQTTKQPRGPVTKAIPIPAIKALNKKSSNIIIFLLLLYFHQRNEYDCDHAHKLIIVVRSVLQIILCNFYLVLHQLDFLNSKHGH